MAIHRTFIQITAGAVLPVTERAVEGDHVFALRLASRSYPTGPAFTGMVEVGKGKHRRHRIRLPDGHHLPLRTLRLKVSLGWTDDRLASLAGLSVECDAADYTRIHDAMLDLAKRFGPAPSRPKERKPLTPGRRHMMAGAAAARGSQGRGR
ncbi:MAG: hypothetical protein FJ104_17580 [Deltaproteobacteria bacterium]|nr:hypothetical protein [Deltaproteobacteria bacterium]